ncbi:MAG: methylmalonyl-CoA mutase family protein [Rhodospirillales bacterium]
MTADDEMRLAEGFEPQSYQTWKNSVEKTLKGGDFDSLLSFKTYDGLQINPLYMRDDLPSVLLRPDTGRSAKAEVWDIRQALTGPSSDDVIRQINEELAGGASSVLLRLDAGLRMGRTVFSNPESVGIDGAALHSVTALNKVLRELPEETPVAFDAGAAGLEVMRSLPHRNWVKGSSFGLDPMGVTATAGLDPSSHDEWFQFAVNEIPEGVTPLTVSSIPYYDAGATEAQELGILIATGVAYLRALEAKGLSVELAAQRMNFIVGLSQDQFTTIAKVRAARALWSAILKSSGVSGSAMRLDGVTSSRMFTRHDPHVNVLRATIAGFAGAVGGLDSITVLPFDTRMGGSQALARRVARNLQVILAEESNLYRVADPAGGSFYVERLTHDLADASFAEFKAIEKAGGIVAAISNGTLARDINQSNETRKANIASRKDAITGVSEFANLEDHPTSNLDLSSLRQSIKADLAANKALLSDVIGSGSGQFYPKPIASVFEALRDASDAYHAKTGGRPKVFLANIGNLQDFNARATFAANAFAAGGIGIAGNSDDGYDTGASAADAFKASGAKIACICGSESGYGEKAIDFAQALKTEGASQIWLAGRAGGNEEAYAGSGIDGYIYVGADIPNALKLAQAAIGV